MDIVALLDRSEADGAIASYLASLKAAANLPASVGPSRQDYLRPPPATSYRSLKQGGVSLQFERQGGEEEPWKLAAVDVYNADALNEGVEARARSDWATFPLLPLDFKLGATSSQEQEAQAGPDYIALSISKDTKASDLVKALGEPSRKGGGEATAGGGASGLGPAAWLEWELSTHGASTAVGSSKFKLMVELAGKDARGAGRWEADRAGRARWGVLTLSVA